MTDKLKDLIEDLRLNHEYCPKEVILKAADELNRMAKRIEEALAQTEQEPVAWEQFYPEMGKPYAFEASMYSNDRMKVDPVTGNVSIGTPQQEAKDEPVAWGVFEGNLHDMFFSQEEAQEMADLKGTHAEVRPLYPAPPQRPCGYVSEGSAERLATNKQAHEQIKNFRLFAHDVPVYTSPPRRTWVGLMRGVRVEGNAVVITVKGGNDEARALCGELINEMEKNNG